MTARAWVLQVLLGMLAVLGPVADVCALTLRPLGPGDESQSIGAVAWSPDGTRIAAHHLVVAPPDYNITATVFAYDVASGMPVVIRGLTALPHAPDAPLQMHPTWSPDGARLGLANDFRLWTVSVADSAATQVDFDESRTPAWSPDGSRFAFAGTGGLWTVAATGGPRSRLTTGLDISPAWSRDGARIAFERTGDLWVMAANGSGAVALTSGPDSDVQPSWSPDGALITFASTRGGKNDIWVVRPATGQLSQLTNDSAVDFSPSWSPDGMAIAFISDRDGTQRVWIATDLTRVGAAPASWWQLKSRYR